MKSGIAALFTFVGLLFVSATVAQQEKSSPNKYQDDARVYEALAKAPEKARAKRNPLEDDPNAVAAGGILFEQHCSECHGKTGDGSKKAPSLRAKEVQNAASGTIFWILTNGVVRRGMPVWSKLPEPQRWQLVRFVKSLGVSSPNISGFPDALERRRPRYSCSHRSEGGIREAEVMGVSRSSSLRGASMNIGNCKSYIVFDTCDSGVRNSGRLFPLLDVLL